MSNRLKIDNYSLPHHHWQQPFSQESSWIETPQQESFNILPWKVNRDHVSKRERWIFLCPPSINAPQNAAATRFMAQSNGMDFRFKFNIRTSFKTSIQVEDRLSLALVKSLISHHGSTMNESTALRCTTRPNSSFVLDYVVKNWGAAKKQVSSGRHSSRFAWVDFAATGYRY